jgi:hypothetical protein
MSAGPLQEAAELREALGDLVDAARAVRAAWEAGDLAAAVRTLVDLADDTADAYGLDTQPDEEESQ